MNKPFFLLIGFLTAICLSNNRSTAQTPLQEFLWRAGEQSFYVQAGRAEADVRIAETQRNNSPDDPEIEYEYMPGIENTSGNRMSYGISQSFSWPGEYMARARYNKLEREQAETVFASEKQEYLLQVKLFCYELVHALKRQEILDWQQANAQQVLELTEKRLAQGEATALDLNNARLNATTVNSAWLEGKAQLDTWRKQLILLTGIEDFDPDSFGYMESLDENPEELLAQAKLSNMTTRVALLESQKSAQNVSVARGSTLPSLRVGVAGERIGPEDSFLGVSAGISIPLWGGSGTVKSARAQKIATDLRTRTIEADIRSSLLEQANTVKQLRQSLEQYGSLKEVKEGIRLLNQSFELQNISVLEYVTNLGFFYQVQKEYLELELRIHQYLAELTKFRL